MNDRTKNETSFRKFFRKVRNKKAKDDSSDTKIHFFGSKLPSSPIDLEYDDSDFVDLVPFIVYDIVYFLLADGIKHEGIFRLGGSTQSIQKIRKLYESGIRVDLFTSCDSPHVASSLLKQYLRELQDPLIPYSMFNSFKLAIQREVVDLEELKLILHSLPPINLACLSFLMLFLHKVSQNSSENKMTSPNISIIFAPNIMKSESNNSSQNASLSSLLDTPISAKTTQYLIDHADFLFETIDDFGMPTSLFSSMVAEIERKNKGGDHEEITIEELLRSSATIHNSEEKIGPQSGPTQDLSEHQIQGQIGEGKCQKEADSPSPHTPYSLARLKSPVKFPSRKVKTIFTAQPALALETEKNNQLTISTPAVETLQESSVSQYPIAENFVVSAPPMSTNPPIPPPKPKKHQTSSSLGSVDSVDSNSNTSIPPPKPPRKKPSK